MYQKVIPFQAGSFVRPNSSLFFSAALLAAMVTPSEGLEKAIAVSKDFFKEFSWLFNAPQFILLTAVFSYAVFFSINIFADKKQ